MLQYVREHLREMEQSVCVCVCVFVRERERAGGGRVRMRVRPRRKLQRHWKQHKGARNRDRGGLPWPSSG